MYTLVTKKYIGLSIYMTLLSVLAGCSVRMTLTVPTDILGVSNTPKISKCQLINWPNDFEPPKLDLYAYASKLSTDKVGAATMMAEHVKDLREYIRTYREQVAKIHLQFEQYCLN